MGYYGVFLWISAIKFAKRYCYVQFWLNFVWIFLVFVKIFIEIERIITHILTNILILPNSNPDSNPTTINSTTITIHGYYPLPDTNSNQLPFQTRILSSTFALLFICQVNPLYLKYHFNSHPLLLLAFL